MYPDYLVHFNPNHDPKTGQFTFSKYLTGSGKLTNYARDEYGISKLDSSKKISDPRKAKKAYEKEYYSLGKVFKRATTRANDLMNELAEKDAENRLEMDIEAANKNKSFVSDWKKMVYDSFKNPDGDWSLNALKEKYPEFSDLIDGFSPSERLSESELNDYMNMVPHQQTYRYRIGRNNWQESTYTVDPISAVLNNDFYYEPDYSGFGKKDITQLTTQANVEYGKYFIEKYGKDIVPQSYIDWVDDNS